MRTQGRLEVTSASVNATIRRIVSPWYRFFVQYDPATDLGRIRVPLLALNGELDCQVRPTENLERIKNLLAAGGNRDVTTIAAMQLNHLFQTAKTGAIAEYALIEETFHEPTLARITQRVRERSGLDR